MERSRVIGLNLEGAAKQILRFMPGVIVDKTAPCLRGERFGQVGVELEGAINRRLRAFVGELGIGVGIIFGKNHDRVGQPRMGQCVFGIELDHLSEVLFRGAERFERADLEELFAERVAFESGQTSSRRS